MDPAARYRLPPARKDRGAFSRPGGAAGSAAINKSANKVPAEMQEQTHLLDEKMAGRDGVPRATLISCVSVYYRGS